MIHYCTYFDSNYLLQGLCLYHSLEEHSHQPFTLWVLCFDELTYQILKDLSLPMMRLIQQEALVRASLQYLAEDDAEANTVAQSLKFAPGGTAKAMCGPLAFAILRDAGLVSKYIDLRDYWLLNPREDGVLLERTFPRLYFDWVKIEKRINAVDYGQFPLQAGDVLYLYQGFVGEEYFERVLVVTRVDGDGRAYTVTNNYTDDA